MNTMQTIQDTTVSNNQSIQTTPYSDSVTMNSELDKLGESLGSFKPYDSQLPIADISGTRIVKCLYQKSTTTGLKVKENHYTRIPTKHLTEQHIVNRISELSNYVLSYLQDEEDKQIKDLHKRGGLKVYTETLSMDKIIEALEMASVSNRLTKEVIEAWFKSDVEDNLAVLFAAKMGITEESSDDDVNKLNLVINAYKLKYASLAGGKTFIKETDCNAMIKVITDCEAQDSILGSRFIVKLENMKKKEDEVLLSL